MIEKVYVVVAKISGNKKVMKVYRYKCDAEIYGGFLAQIIKKKDVNNRVFVIEQVLHNCFDPMDLENL